MKTNKTLNKWLVRLDSEAPWTETEIRSFKRQLGNASTLSSDNKGVLEYRYFHQNTPDYSITKEQTLKGLEYLKRKAFKRNGELRKSKQNPFGEREAHIIKNFKEFKFVGLYNESHRYGGCTWYSPVYRVISKDGKAFEYIGSRDILVLQ